ncbi:MAG: helix-turn-helix domain-containing protein [bacterium]|nr:helix-turn-helix domain-containing protein [bacterium]
MTWKEEQAVLSNAAAESFKRIREDRATASSEGVRDMLAHLEERLLDPEFTTGDWLKECGTTKTTQVVFHAEVGFPPGFYLWDSRMEIAARLLQGTDVSVELVALLLGFSGAKSFGGAFKRWSGLRPVEYRKKIRKTFTDIGPPSEDYCSTGFLKRMIDGKLEPSQAEELFDRLRTIYAITERENTAHSNGLADSDEREIELHSTEKLWEKIKNRDFSVQRLLVAHQLHFETPALFDFLREKSLEEGRGNRQRGVQLAQLALASLDTCAEALAEDLPNRLAQAWICLGNAHCLAAELSRAEQGFSLAESELQRAGPRRDPLVEADLHVKKAKMRWYQRRYKVALELVDRAISVFRGADQHVAYAQSLIVKSCILRDSGNPKAAIPSFRESLSFITKKDQPYLCLSAQTGLACAHRLLGEYGEAEEALAEAEGLCEVLDFKVGGYQVRWIAGLVKQGRGDFELAEHYLEEARSGLAEMGEMGYTAIVLLDLAILYAEQGRSSQAADPAIEALPLLDALRLGREAVAAIRVLRDAIEAGELTLSVLKEARAVLAEIDRELHGLGAAVDAHE